MRSSRSILALLAALLVFVIPIPLIIALLIACGAGIAAVVRAVLPQVDYSISLLIGVLTICVALDFYARILKNASATPDGDVDESDDEDAKDEGEWPGLTLHPTGVLISRRPRRPRRKAAR